MKILIIRHGEPDYSIDSLTEKGWREAELLSDKLKNMQIKAFYVSPLGRARDTASFTLEKTGQTAEICDWLREFDAPINGPDGNKRITWDWLPGEWTAEDKYYSRDLWYTTPIMEEGKVIDEAKKVYTGLDSLIAKHGYERNGNCYNAVNPNNDTIALFCHFGVECVMLGHLLGVSPMVLWHGFCALPSSVTTLVTEERRKGTAYFRMLSFGDTSHLYIAGEQPSFAARFCETFDNENERHD
ncbi:histidine phosphatase family protein [Porcipelethomonas sp.]|uniref:histidine phosphatase family protein n=1 Tax=Porcipelethomonas sp. TaxID=2981675 RepID=UPI003EF8A99D